MPVEPPSYYPWSVTTSGYYGPVFVKCLSFKTFGCFLLCFVVMGRRTNGVCYLCRGDSKQLKLKKGTLKKEMDFLIKTGVKQHFSINVYYEVIIYYYILPFKNVEFVETICF